MRIAHSISHAARLTALALILTLTLQASFRPAHAQFGDSALVEASRKEDKGVLIYGELTNTQMGPLIKAFNAKYPWIKITNVDTDDYEVFDEYYQDLDNEDRPADVLFSSAYDQWEEFVDKNDLLKYVSVDDATLPDIAKDDLGIYMMYTDPALIIWNTKSVTNPPKSLEEIAKLVDSNPKAYQNSIATYDMRKSEVAFDLYWSYIRKKGEAAWNIFDRIGKSTIRPETDSEKIVNDVVTGQSKIAFFVEGSAVHEHLDNPNFGWAAMRDGMPVAEYFTGITAKSVSPNSAKLWLDFVLSAEGQTALAEGGLPAYRPELRGKVKVHLDDFLEGVNEDDFIYFDFDKDIENENKEQAFEDRWLKAFQLQPDATAVRTRTR